MAKMTKWTTHPFSGTLLVCLISLVSQSPCPEHFRYYRNETTSELMATVEISKVPYGVPLHLKVVLSVPTILPTNYVGRIELAKSRDESMRDITTGLPLFYRIYFPLRHPVPVLVSIRFNDALICVGNPASAVFVTNIILEHSVLPAPQPIPLPQSLMHFNKPITRPITQSPKIIFPPKLDESELYNITVKPFYSTTTEKSPFLNSYSENTCGLTGGKGPLTSSTRKFSTQPWPWIAAIFFMDLEVEFKCAGNLISHRLILTTAYCLEWKGKKIPSNLLLVTLGRSNLTDWVEPGSLTLYVDSYEIHPDYTGPSSSDSDLAIVKMKEFVKFSATVRPVCLWMGPTEFDRVMGGIGFLVGWGRNRDGTQHLENPRSVRVPIASQDACIRSNLHFHRRTSSRTFCAGNRGDTGICNADSGTGLYMFHPQSGRYHLRGLVSLSLLDERNITCDTRQYVIYVDVAKYLLWIDQRLKKI